MRRNVKNDKVIKAITIGLATMIAASSMPVSVFAEDVNTPDVPESQPLTTVDTTDMSNIDGGVADDAQKAAEAVEASINTDEAGTVDATDAIKTVTDDIADAENGVKVGEAGNKDGKDLAQEVINASDSLKSDESLSNAEEKVKEIEQDLIIAENIDARETELSENAVKASDDAVKVADDFASDMKEASDKATDLSEAITNATSIADAQNAYDELETLATDAAKKVTDANDKLAKLQEDFDAAKAQLLAAVATYNAVISNSSTDASKIKEDVESAEQKVEALQTAISNAQSSIEAANKSALDIINAQNTVKDNTSVAWRDEDKLFKAIMEGYYIPAIVDKDAKNISVTWDWQSDDDSFNYCTVTYKVGNEKVTKYYNYKMEAGSKSNIEIFEKTADEVGAAKYLKEITKNVSNSSEKSKIVKSGVYKYTDANNETKYITGSEIEAGKSDGSIVVVDGKTYIKGQATNTNVLISEVAAPIKVDDIEATGDKLTAIDIKEDTVESHYEIQDSKLVYITKGTVGETEYERKQYVDETYHKAYTEEEKNALIKDGMLYSEFTEVAEMDASGNVIKYYVLTGDSISNPELSVTIGKGEDHDNGKGNDKITIKADSEDYAILGVQAEIVNTITGINSDIKRVEFSDNKLVATQNGNSKNYKVTGSITVTIDNASVTLVGDEYKTGEFNTEEAAKKALIALVSSYFNSESNKDFAFNCTGCTDIQYSTDEYSKYKAYIDYLEIIKAEAEKENQTISVEEYELAVAIGSKIVANENYVNKNLLLTESTDAGLKAFLDNAQALVDKYAKIKEEADAAKAKLDEYSALVANINNLQTEIRNLSSSDNRVITVIEALHSDEENFDLAKYLGIELTEIEENAFSQMTVAEALDYLEKKITKAKGEVETAQKKLDEINDLLEDAEDELERTIERLTPPTPVVPGDTPDGTPAGEAGTVVVTPFAALPTAAGVAGVRRVAGVVGGAGIGTGDGAEDQGVLGARVEKEDPEKDKKATITDKKEDTKKPVKLEEEEAPLAAMPEETKKANWWWLLIIAILGATGAEMYKKHEEKKKEQAAVSESVNKK